METVEGIFMSIGLNTPIKRFLGVSLGSMLGFYIFRPRFVMAADSKEFSGFGDSWINMYSISFLLGGVSGVLI